MLILREFCSTKYSGLFVYVDILENPWLMDFLKYPSPLRFASVRFIGGYPVANLSWSLIRIRIEFSLRYENSFSDYFVSPCRCNAGALVSNDAVLFYGLNMPHHLFWMYVILNPAVAAPTLHHHLKVTALRMTTACS